MYQFVSDFIQSHIGQALIIAAVTSLVARLFTARGKLVWGVSHRHHYRVPNLADGSNFPVITQQVWFQNIGRSAITNLEIVLNWKPQHFEIWDPRSWEQASTPDGRHILKLPSLNAGEFFTLSMIETNNDLPNILSVRWLGGSGKQVKMGPARQFPMWFSYSLIGILLCGVTAIGFVLLQIALKFF